MVRLHEENYGVYGVRRMHALTLRQGWAIGRDQTARIMRLQGLVGVRRSKKVFTTKSDPAATRPALEWVWWNNQRLHGELGMLTPNEVEAAYYADHESPRLATASHGKS